MRIAEITLAAAALAAQLHPRDRATGDRFGDPRGAISARIPLGR